MNPARLPVPPLGQEAAEHSTHDDAGQTPGEDALAIGLASPKAILGRAPEARHPRGTPRGSRKTRRDTLSSTVVSHRTDRTATIVVAGAPVLEVCADAGRKSTAFTREARGNLVDADGHAAIRNL